MHSAKLLNIVENKKYVEVLCGILHTKFLCAVKCILLHTKRVVCKLLHTRIEEANEQSINELIKEAENQFIELKEQFSEGVMKTISAFANTSGGVILIGVKDNKEVVGVNLKVGAFEEIINKNCR